MIMSTKLAWHTSSLLTVLFFFNYRMSRKIKAFFFLYLNTVQQQKHFIYNEDIHESMTLITSNAHVS